MSSDEWSQKVVLKKFSIMKMKKKLFRIDGGCKVTNESSSGSFAETFGKTFLDGTTI